MLLASSLGKIVHPLFIAFATLLAWFYELVPNYAIAIAMLTVAVMIVVFPITRRATRSMMKMQLLAPELKKIQAKYKAQPSMSVAEKQESRTRLNEEMMALYKENGVSPTGGCLPMFMQFPIFIILYDTIRALTHTVKVNGVSHLQPLYINHSSKLYHAITASGGKLDAFGINLANSVRTAGLPWGSKIPLLALILVAIALQYVQIRQLSGRNPAAAAANPQMQQMQKFFPIIFAVIYIAIPAGVNVYFIVSNLFRITQQEFMYRRDPHIRAAMEKLKARAKTDPKVVEAKAAIQRNSTAGRKGLLARFAPPPALPAASSPSEPPAKPPASGSTNGSSTPRSNGRSAPRRSTGPRGRSTNNGSNGQKSQPRAQGKRPRRAR